MTTSIEQNPLHIFQSAGLYSVILTASNGAGSGTSSLQTVTVTAAPVITPVADFTATATTGVAPLSVQFTDRSTNANGWLWNFGDTITSIEQNPIHTYAAAGTYIVQLQAINSTLNTFSTKSMTITVNPEITVKTPAEAISDMIAQVKSFGLPKGIETSLTAKLNAAIAALERGNEKTAINNLNAFMNEVKAQQGKKLTDAQANTLSTKAQMIIQSI